RVNLVAKRAVRDPIHKGLIRRVHVPLDTGHVDLLGQPTGVAAHADGQRLRLVPGGGRRHALGNAATRREDKLLALAHEGRGRFDRLLDIVEAAGIQLLPLPRGVRVLEPGLEAGVYEHEGGDRDTADQADRANILDFAGDEAGQVALLTQVVGP